MCIKLSEANLKVKTRKCVFGTSKVKFLGYDVTPNGIYPDEDKIKSVKDYPVPENPREVKRFLGFATYYRKFIPNYSSITEPIKKLLKKDNKFEWNRTCQKVSMI